MENLTERSLALDILLWIFDKLVNLGIYLFSFTWWIVLKVIIFSIYMFFGLIGIAIYQGKK